jgi:hypothetical protein
MRKKLFIVFLSVVAICELSAQVKYPARLKVFVDCLNGCDMNFIRTEINIIDYSLDRQAADVHVLINDQNTGSGGDEYQLIFFGQNQFKNIIDTLRFVNEANNTDFEERALLVKYLKLGLAPFIAKTGMARLIDIKMKLETADSSSAKQETIKDKWNYWVINTGVSGNVQMDANYKESKLNGSINVTRVTDKVKIGFEFEGSKTRAEFEVEDTGGNLKTIINRNDEVNLEHYLVKSIDQHWSWAYQGELFRNTFSNFKSGVILRTGIEYNIFPYKLVNTKKFTIAYILDARRNYYIDTTLYEKTKESLLGHSLEAKLSLNQKWGRIYISSSYHNYFNNWKYFNLGLNTTFDIRITGGLSFYIFSGAELVRDQLYLPKEGAKPEEVLTRRRQLASGYRFYTDFGFNYRFGSKLNNFVNPRFD